MRNTPTPSFLAEYRYECSWQNFRSGFMDWWAERCDPASSVGGASPSGLKKPVWAVALIAWGMVLGLGFAAALLGPGLATGMGLMGTKAFASLAMVLTAVIALALLVGAPAWIGWKLWTFSKAMCLRGWELQVGQRKRYGAR